MRINSVLLLLLLASSLIVVIPPAEAQLFEVQNDTMWLDPETGFLHLFGEVTSSRDHVEGFTPVHATLRDVDGLVLDEFEGYTLILIAPRGVRAPFDLVERDKEVAARTATYSLVAGASGLQFTQSKQLEITSISETKNERGYLEVSGEVLNDGLRSIVYNSSDINCALYYHKYDLPCLPFVVGTFYDTSGEVVYVGRDELSGAGAIPVGSTWSYRLTVPSKDLSDRVAKYYLITEGYTEPLSGAYLDDVYTNVPEFVSSDMLLALVLTAGLLLVARRRRGQAERGLSMEQQTTMSCEEGKRSDFSVHSYSTLSNTDIDPRLTRTSRIAQRLRCHFCEATIWPLDQVEA